MLGAYALAHLGRRLPGLKGVHMKRAKNHALMQLNIATEKNANLFMISPLGISKCVFPMFMDDNLAISFDDPPISK